MDESQQTLVTTSDTLVPQCVGELLIHSLSYDVDRPVVTFAETGQVVTAQEYGDLVSTYVQALNSLGLSPKTRIGLLSRNRTEVLLVNGAFFFVDLCAVSLHPMGAVDDFLYMIKDAEVEALVFDPRYYQDTAKVLQERLPQLKHLLALGPTEVGQDLSALAREFTPEPLQPRRNDPEELVRINYSGGTTGKPKGIISSARNRSAILDILLKEWEWPKEIRQLVCSPLSHGGGSVFLPTMVKRGSMVVLSGFEPTAVLEAIQEHRITCVLLVPTMIYALLDHPRIDEYDLSSLEIIYYGAAAISPSRLKEGIEKFGPIFFQFYGQTESPMSVSVMKRDEHDPEDLIRLASCGRPVPWVRVALLDDNCAPVADGDPGEICVQGPLLMSGYLNKPEATDEALRGGWLHTGDVAVRDEKGFLRIVDRKKDMIVTGGFNVYPREVEDVISSHPQVSAAAVIGVPHPKWGESIKAVVVLKPDAQVTEAELIALVKATKGSVQAPKSIVFADHIPLSGLGKPDKKALRAQYTN